MCFGFDFLVLMGFGFLPGLVPRGFSNSGVTELPRTVIVAFRQQWLPEIVPPSHAKLRFTIRSTLGYNMYRG